MAGIQPNNNIRNNVPPCVIQSLNDRSDNKYPINPITHHVMRSVAITANISFVDFIVIKEFGLKYDLVLSS